MAKEPGRRLCEGDLEGNWVEVHPAEGAPGRWLVVVDVAIPLCAEHKLRLLDAVGLPDVVGYDPPRRPFGFSRG